MSGYIKESRPKLGHLGDEVLHFVINVINSVQYCIVIESNLLWYALKCPLTLFDP